MPLDWVAGDLFDALVHHADDLAGAFVSSGSEIAGSTRAVLRTNTSVNLSDKVNELADGTVCSLNATTGGGIRPYRKSQIIPRPLHPELPLR